MLLFKKVKDYILLFCNRQTRWVDIKKESGQFLKLGTKVPNYNVAQLCTIHSVAVVLHCKLPFMHTKMYENSTLTYFIGPQRLANKPGSEKMFQFPFHVVSVHKKCMQVIPPTRGVSYSRYIFFKHLVGFLGKTGRVVGLCLNKLWCHVS